MYSQSCKIPKITLKACRVNKGLSLKEAAKALQISAYTLGNYEAGRTFPNTKLVMQIENLYGISYNNIIFCPKITV